MNRCHVCHGTCERPGVICDIPPHIVMGKFQSDKYPETPAGLIPFKATDVMAQDLLWEYAERRRSTDADFADALQLVLEWAGYHPLTSDPPQYDYDNQAWIKDGEYQDCGHPQDLRCACFGRAHARERAPSIH